MTERELMQQALEALEHVAGAMPFPVALQVRAALRERLAQPEQQEPVAWMTHSNDLLPLFHSSRAAALNWALQPTPLYTRPQAREWMGLTDEEIQKLAHVYDNTAPWTLMGFARAIEAKLREKNS